LEKLYEKNVNIQIDAWRIIMKIKRVHELTYHLNPEQEQRRLKIIQTRTLETSYANEFALEIHTHIGTHIEGPYHCLENGKKLDELPIDTFLGEAAIIDLTWKEGDRKIMKKDLMKSGNHIKWNDIVLLKTGYDQKFSNEELQSEEYMANSPYLSDNAVDWLIEKGIKNMGIDFWSIEEYPIDPNIGEPKHIRLFNRDIPFIHSIVNLVNINAKRVFFIALPMYIKGLDSSPVRAVAIEYE
jgi:arylformamidase